MKKLIINTLLFCIVPAIVAVTTPLIYKYKLNHLQLDESTHILILGDSHTQYGLDDSIISNSLNISQSAQHFIYSFNVLKQLLNTNSQIDKIILGVSFHSFAKKNDRNIQAADKTKFMFPTYFPILNTESIIDINKIPLRQGINIYKHLFRSLFFYSSIHDYAFIGSFSKSSKKDLNENTLNDAIRRHFFTEYGIEQEYSDFQIKYLAKIVELCNAMNTELIIINTPIPDDYYKKIPPKFVTNYYANIQQFNNKIQFYDLHSMELKRDNYSDGDHLNYIGAKAISALVNEKINAKD